MFSLCGYANAASDTWFDNNDGTVLDVASGLIWQQEDDGITRNQIDAAIYCEDLIHANITDWRLPNVKELISIVDFRIQDLAIDEGAFLNVQDDYWTSTPYAVNVNEIYTVSFTFGSDSREDIYDLHYVRCVH